MRRSSPASRRCCEAPRKGAAGAPLLAGTLTASGRIEGRWPDLRSDGELQAAALRLGPLAVRRGEGRWRLGSAADAPMSGTLALDGVDLAGRPIERVRAELSGTGARAQGRAADRVAGPAAGVDRRDRDAAHRGSATAPATPSATAPASAAPRRTATAGGQPQRPSSCSLEGGLVDAGGERAAGWSGTRARAARAKPGGAGPHLAARARAARQLLLERRPATRQPRAGQRRSARRDAALEPRRLAGGRRPRRQRPPRCRRDHRPAADRAAAARRRSPTSAGAAISRSRAGSRRMARRRCGWTRWSSAPAATSASPTNTAPSGSASPTCASASPPTTASGA